MCEIKTEAQSVHSLKERGRSNQVSLSSSATLSAFLENVAMWRHVTFKVAESDDSRLSIGFTQSSLMNINPAFAIKSSVK